MTVTPEENYKFVSQDKCEQTNVTKYFLFEDKQVTFPK